MSLVVDPSSAPSPLVKIDLSGDGLDDLVYWNYEPGNNLSISTAQNDGHGAFVPSSLNIAGDVLTGKLLYCCTVVKDLNGDGQQDIVYGSSTGTVQVSLAGAHHAFPPATTVAALPIVSSGSLLAVELADFNGDHLPDIAVLYEGTNPAPQNHRAVAILKRLLWR